MFRAGCVGCQIFRLDPVGNKLDFNLPNVQASQSVGDGYAGAKQSTRASDAAARWCQPAGFARDTPAIKANEG